MITLEISYRTSFNVFARQGLGMLYIKLPKFKRFNASNLNLFKKQNFILWFIYSVSNAEYKQ